MASDNRHSTRAKKGKFVSSAQLKKRKTCSQKLKHLQLKWSREEQVESRTGLAEGSEMLWDKGRRVVELSVLAQGLQACIDCKKPLQLKDTFNEKRYGLASLLSIHCNCGQINTVSTGKSHRPAGSSRGVPIYDINTKLATGITFAFAFKYPFL